jgi:NAD(P)-dependent dehydrogenase (short-subunit alcohol dehydrogenase family)
VNVAGLRCVVTGAASGIGAAVARRLVDSGAEVAAIDIREPSVPGARYVECDLSDPASIEAAVRALGAGWQVLCNVAGVPGTADPELVVRTNFLGPRLLTEGLLPGFTDGGAIVNVASTNGAKWQRRLPLIESFLAADSFADGLAWYAARKPEGTAYAFSKEAVIVYSTVLAERQRARGIRVNSVSPGATDTTMLPELRIALGPAKLDRVGSVLGRYARPDEIATTIVFLASAEARWVNGHNLVVDGGYLSGSQFRKDKV